MKHARLIRTHQSAHGTEGILSCGELSLYTLELPWRDNKPNISCIPPKHYQVVPRRSPKFGDIYHVTHVEGRSHILIHAGNFAGDAAKGLRTNVQGCILLGRKIGFIEKQKAVLASRLAVNDFRGFMQKEEFTLEIIEFFSNGGEGP